MLTLGTQARGGHAASYVTEYYRGLVLHSTEAHRYELPVAGGSMIVDVLLAGETRDIDKRKARLQAPDQL